MKQSTLLLLSLTTVILSLTSCLKYEEVEFNGISDMELKQVGLKGVVIELEALINNPNNYKIAITDYDLDLYLDGKSLDKAKIKEKIVLPKKSEGAHRITVSADAKSLLGAGLPGLFSMGTGGPMNVQVKGNIKAKAKGIKKSFPVDFAHRVEM